MTGGRTLVVPIYTARIKHDSVLGIQINLDITMPEVSVAKDRLNTSPPSLKWTQKPRHNLFQQLVGECLELRVLPADILLPRNLGPKLPREPLLPRVAPLVVNGRVALIRLNWKTKLTRRRRRRCMELLEDLS